jgi:DNA repair exonuclease SbcCD ATPase subunit
MTDSFSIPGYRLLSAEASQEEISNILGVSFDLFTNTVLFCQNTRNRNVKDFIDCSDADQKDRFRQLFNLGVYEESGQMVSTDYSGALIRQSERTSQSDRLKQELTLMLEQQESLQADNKAWEQSQADRISSLKQQLDQMGKRKTLQDTSNLENLVRDSDINIGTLQRTIDAFKIQLTTATTKLNQLELQIKAKQGQLDALQIPTAPEGVDPNHEKLESELREKIQELKEESSTLAQAKIEAEQEARDYHQRVQAMVNRVEVGFLKQTGAVKEHKRVTEIRTRLQSQFAEIENCPTCGQKYTEPGSKEKASKDILQRISELVFPDLEAAAEEIRIAQKELAENPKLEQAFPAEQLGAGISERQILIQEHQTKLTALISKKADAEKYHRELALYTQLRKNYSDEIAVLLEERRICTTSFLVLQQQERIDLPTWISELEDLQNQKQELLTKKAEIMASNNQVEEFNTRLETLTQGLKIESTALWPMLGRFEMVTDRITRIKNDLQSMEEGNKELALETELLGQLKTAFGNEGIVAELLREYIPTIQQRTNEYLSFLTNNELQVEFLSDRTLKKKGEDGNAATRAQFQIQVRKSCGGDGYDLISGSEQNKAALVVNWAVGDLAGQSANLSCNLRVFDEIFDSLDAKGMNRLAELLALNQSGTRLTFIITHKVELEDSFQHKILLEKKQGKTRLVGIQ